MAASLVLDRPASERTELMFFSSQRVRSSSEPVGRTETLASTRIEPSSILASLTSMARRMSRNSET